MIFTHRWRILLVALWITGAALVNITAAADPAFVGALALAVDEEGIEALGLDQETVQKLEDLILRRESDALKLSREIRDLPPAEIAKRLEPFVAESERQGMELLTLEQREKLSQLKIARGGMTTLADDEVARVLALTDQQRQQVTELMQQRAQDMTIGGENQRRLTQAIYERKLIGILSAEQRAGWEKLAGFGPGTLDSAAEAEGAAPIGESDEEAASIDEQVAASDTDAADADAEEGAPGAETPAGNEKRMSFSFRNADWEEVLYWFADNAGLSLNIKQMPEGTFTYRDDQKYTPAEALDLLNSMLLVDGYTLVRRGRMLMLLDLEQPLPPEMVELVDVSELDERGDFELVKCVFHLARMTPEDAEVEIAKLLGPGRTAVVLPQSRQIVVTETAGKMRMIRDLIKSVENPDRVAGNWRDWRLQHVMADDVMDVARGLLGIEDDAWSNDQINISSDAYRQRLFATGNMASLELLDRVVKETDIEPDPIAGNGATVEKPYLDTYSIRKADLQTVMDVLSSQLAGLPNVRMASDTTSNKLIIQATRADHAMIRETINKLEGEARRVEAIQLSTSDPQMVVLAINKLFGMTGEEASTSGMRVDADPSSNLILVYGTDQEIEQVRELVNKMEGPSEFEQMGNVRMIPLTQNQMEQIFPQLEAIWPSMSKNRIRMVVPNQRAGSSQRFRERSTAPEVPERSNLRRPPADNREEAVPPQRERNARPDASLRRPASEPTITARIPARADYFQLVSTPAAQEGNETQSDAAPAQATDDQQNEPAPVNNDENQQDNVEPAEDDIPAESLPAEDNREREVQETVQESLEGADIVVTMTPNGLLVTSQDPEALDRFEGLMRMLMQQQGVGTGLLKRDVAVFYLRYVQAEVAANQLKDILGGTATSSGGSIGDMASNLIGGSAGGIFGALMGGGGGGSTTTGPIKAGNVSIVADPRLNRLIVQGDASELDEIEELLQFIDKDESLTEILTAGSPHVIYLDYASADKVAQIIQSAYTDRVSNGQNQQGGGGGGGRQPGPEDIIRMIRGGRGGNEDQARGELPKMTVAVDADNNAIIVRAPDSLYQEIKELVEILDQPNTELSESIEVVALDSNGSLLYNALRNLTGSTGGAAPSTSNNNNNRQGGGQQGQNVQDAMQQIQRWQQFREQMGGGGRGGRGGRGGGGGFGGGGGGFGGRGGRGGRGN